MPRPSRPGTTPSDLVEDYGPLVSALCRRMIRDPEAAADAAQECWYQILLALPGFRGESKASTWIYSIAVRVIRRFAEKENLYSLRFLRSVFHEDKIASPDGDRESKSLWVKQECDRCLTGILHCLDTDSRLIYLFREVAELSWAQIGAVMGWTDERVRQAGSRANRKLRRFLNDECSLFHPTGPCTCRMSSAVKDVDLPAEYQRIRDITGRVRLFRESAEVLPGKNFWLSFVTE